MSMRDQTNKMEAAEKAWRNCNSRRFIQISLKSSNKCSFEQKQVWQECINPSPHGEIYPQFPFIAAAADQTAAIK